MRRTLFPLIPLSVALTVFMLDSSTVRAAQEPSPPATSHSCACCEKSGNDAMNHPSTAGCCGSTAAPQAAAEPDHSAHVPEQSDTTDGSAASAAHAAGCCGDMTAAHAPAKDGSENHAGGGCDKMAMNHVGSAPAESHATEQEAGGCCANMHAGHTPSAEASIKTAEGGCCH
jgi:hypothetical protein